MGSSLSTNTTSPNNKITEDNEKWTKEERDFFQSLQDLTMASSTSSSSSSMNNNNHKNVLPVTKEEDWMNGSTSSGKNTIHPLIGLGLGTAFVLNLGILLSLPPVLRGKGAPYLPTFSRNLTIMFQQLQKHPLLLLQNASTKRRLTFVDLGSGDGRVVFAAARQTNMFHQSIGYEINPVLHGWAHLRRLIQAPKYWNNTQFYIQDLWKVNLSSVDVVAVYGLQPIMKDLGIKLQNELRPGSVVVSNVFAIPGWNTNIPSTHGVHIYTIPPLLPKKKNNNHHH